MLNKLRSLFSRENGSVVVALIFLTMGALFSYYEASQATLNHQKEAHIRSLQATATKEKEREEHLKAATSPEAIKATEEAIARDENGAVGRGERLVIPAEATPTPVPLPVGTPMPSRSEAWWSLLFGK